MWAPLRRHLGRRGLVLISAGYLWMLAGWAVAIMPNPTHRALAPHEFIDIKLRVGGWLITGAAALVFAFIRNLDLNRWGFGLLALMPLERLLSWALVAIFHATDRLFGWAPMPLPELGNALGGISAWGAVCLLIYAVATWEEPPDPAAIRELVT